MRGSIGISRPGVVTGYDNTPPSHRRARRAPDTLAGRLALVLIAFILVATVVSGTVEYSRGRAALLDEARQQLDARAQVVQDRLDHLLNDRLRLLAAWPQLDVAQDLAIDDIDKRLAASLDQLARSFDDYPLTLGVLASGRVVASPAREWTGTDVSSTGWWRPPASPPPRVRIAEDRRRPLLVAEGDVVSRSTGKPLGRIVVLTPLNDVLAGASLRDTAYLLVRSTDGRERFRGRRTTAEGLIWSRERRVDAGDVHLRLAMAEPRSAALAPLHGIARQLIVFSAIVLLVGIPVALLLVHSTTAALRRLTLEAGATDARDLPRFDAIPASAPREVRVLAGALTDMVDRLEASREALVRQESLAAMGTMAATLAHEVRTPLSVMRGSAEMLARAARPGTREAEMSGFLLEEVDRLGRLVDDLLRFARARPPEPAPMDLAEPAGRAAGALAPAAAEAGVAFATRLDPAPISGDAGQWYQVMLNLLTNAFEASAAGGEVLVTTTVEEGRARVEVTDQGRGIPPEHLGTIWKPFFTTRSGGTGLGLPVVRRIVEAHGGEITLDSQPGAGTRVVILLPARESP